LQRLRGSLLELRDKLAPQRAPSKASARPGRQQALPHGLDRKKVLQVVDKTLGMIEFALRHGAVMVFGGD
jgi:hypothetical protein